MKTRVAILVFDEVEVLDFAGPFEVFSRTRTTPGVESRRSDATAPFDVYTVGERGGPIIATGGLRFEAQWGFADAPSPDILVVPGGFGTRALLDRPTFIAWIQASAQSAKLVTSVCTGALLLARAGLLRERRATTHWGALDLLAKIEPLATVEAASRVVDDSIITSAGVSAGIDMALDVVERVCGKAVADDTARYMEYVRHTPA